LILGPSELFFLTVDMNILFCHRQETEGNSQGRKQAKTFYSRQGGPVRLFVRASGVVQKISVMSTFSCNYSSPEILNPYMEINGTLFLQCKCEVQLADNRNFSFRFKPGYRNLNIHYETFQEHFIM